MAPHVPGFPTSSNLPDPEYTFGNFRLASDGTLMRSHEEVHLPPKELAALRVLLMHAGQVVTRAQLKQELWGDVHVTPDSVPRCLSSLRARLEPDRCIQTLYKRGYRLIGNVVRYGSAAQPAYRLAILPFTVGQGADEFLGPAIAEEATARLTEINYPTLAILARDSVFALTHRGHSAVEVGKALRADLVLTGKVFATPSHFRLRTEMVRVEDATQVWIEDMMVARSQVAELKLELASRLQARLGADLAGEKIRLAKAPSAVIRPDAYESFLRGHHDWQSFDRHRMVDGMQSLLLAAELDPNLLAAKVDLARVIMAQELVGFMPPRVAADRIRGIFRAISDSGLDEPALLPARGWIAFHVDRDLGLALELFSQSAHIPHDAWTTRLRVMLALSCRRFEEATEWLHSALLVDPYAPWLHATLAWASHLAGDVDASRTQIEDAIRLFPEHDSTRFYGSILLAYQGDAERAEKMANSLVREKPYFDLAAAAHAYALARSGRNAEGGEVLQRMQWLSRERFVLTSFQPAAYLALGDVDSALSELRAGNDIRCPWFFQSLADPRLKDLHGHPEFEQMQASLNSLVSAAGESSEFQA